MSKRSNCWSCIIYPGDSAPENYIQIIQGWHIPTLISPIHDPDQRSIDAQEKKKHIHVMLNFGSGANKSEDQVRSFTDQLNGTRPFIVHSPFGMVRYFIHFDNPEKQQFDRSELITFSGFDPDPAFDTFDEEQAAYCSLEDFIITNNIYNFFILVKLLKDYNLIQELNFLRKHSLYFSKILDGSYQLFIKDNNKNIENNNN